MELNKLLEFQKKVGAITKDETNPFFKSKYFDINGLIKDIKPVLDELGLVLVQPIKVAEGKNVLFTVLYDGGANLLESSMILPDNIDPQKMGSAITYYRRYAIQSMLLLQAEDDDANTVSQPPKVYNKGFESEAVANSRFTRK